jgi:hypothetical protein
MSPVIVVAPVLVTVDAPRTAKPVADRSSDVALAGAAAKATNKTMAGTVLAILVRMTTVLDSRKSITKPNMTTRPEQIP